MPEQIYAENPQSMDTMGGLGLATLYAALGEKEKHRQFCEKFFRVYARRWKAPEKERPAKAFSAMATFNQGNAPRARQLLTQAESEFGIFGRTNPVWNDFHAIKLAIDEAKALIR